MELSREFFFAISGEKQLRSAQHIKVLYLQILAYNTTGYMRLMESERHGIAIVGEKGRHDICEGETGPL